MTILSQSDYWVFFDVFEDEGLRDSLRDPDVARAMNLRSSQAARRLRGALTNDPPSDGSVLAHVAASFTNDWYNLAALEEARMRQRGAQDETFAAGLRSAAEMSFKSAADLRVAQAKVMWEMRSNTVTLRRLALTTASNLVHRAEAEFETAAIQRDRLRLADWAEQTLGGGPLANYTETEGRYQRALWACWRDYDFILRYYARNARRADELLSMLTGDGALDRRGHLRPDLVPQLVEKDSVDDLLTRLAGGVTQAETAWFVKIDRREWDAHWSKVATEVILHLGGEDPYNSYWLVPLEFRPRPTEARGPYLMLVQPAIPLPKQLTGGFSPTDMRRLAGLATVFSDSRPEGIYNRRDRNPIEASARQILSGVFVSGMENSDEATDGGGTTVYLGRAGHAFTFASQGWGTNRVNVPYRLRWARQALDWSEATHRGLPTDAAGLRPLHFPSDPETVRALKALERAGGQTRAGEQTFRLTSASRACNMFIGEPLLGQWQLFVPKKLVTKEGWTLTIAFFGITLRD